MWWFSECGPQTTSISIVWVLVRNANSLAHSRPTESGMLEVGPGNLCFTGPMGDSEAHGGLRLTGLELWPFHMQIEDSNLFISGK